MNCHQENNLRLQEAMTKELENSIRIWSVEGLQVEGNVVPENTPVQTTYVYKDPSGYYELAIMADFEGKDDYFSKGIAKFPTLDFLKERYPNLFEMEGNLFAFL